MCGVMGMLVVAVIGQYDPPAGYYNSATGTGTVLEAQLHNIIDDHVVRSYDDARFAIALLDQDPNNPDNIILIYDQLSVDGTWDGGVTFTREHVWPRSRQVIGGGASDTGPDNSDLHILRPCTPSVNGARGALNFGGFRSTYGPSGVYWYPGVVDTGDVARALFYMQVRYDGSDAATVDLELVNGNPAIQLGQHGDLSSLLLWHYSDPVSEFERRRNHLIWSSTDDPLYFQGNRNPFIDRPEFVWAIWGSSANNSTLYFGDSAPGDGASTVNVNLRSLTGTSPSSQIITLNKAGTTPTTFDIAVGGDAYASPTGPRQTFLPGPRTLDVTVGVTAPPVTGSYTGSVTVNNTDLTSAGAGQGSADGNDLINLTAEVLDHAEGSFSDTVDQDALVIEFDPFPSWSGVKSLSFNLYNLESTPGLTAALHIDSVSGSGYTNVLYSDVASSGDIPAGQGGSFTAFFKTNVPPGVCEAIYQIDVSDENVPGAQAGAPLTLTLRGTVTAAGIPAAGTWAVVFASLLVATCGTVALRRRLAH